MEQITNHKTHLHIISMVMSRGLGYTDVELQALLDIVEEVLPRSPNEWEAVSQHHIKNYPGRTLDSISHKLNALLTTRNPLAIPIVPLFAEQNISLH